MTVKKILCPTDFSAAANNAVEYAACLAKKTGAKLTLMHVDPVPFLLLEDMNNSVMIAYEKSREENLNQIKDQCLEVNKTFGITCDYNLDSINLEQAVALKTENGKLCYLIVIGTNGIDNLSQFYFGTNSYLVANKVECPTLIVPEGCEYKEIANVVFASDYNAEDELFLQQLKDFMENYNPHLYVLHISRKDSPVSEEIYHSFCNLTNEALEYNEQIEFKRTVNEDVEDGINNFIHGTQVDLLAMSINHHGFLYRLFHRDIIRNITSVSNLPVLLFHK